MNYNDFRDKMPPAIYYADKTDVYRLEFHGKAACDLWSFWCNDNLTYLTLDVGDLEEFCFEDKTEALKKAFRYAKRRMGEIIEEIYNS